MNISLIDGASRQRAATVPAMPAPEIGCAGTCAGDRFRSCVSGETLALELAPFGVRVAVVEPGSTRTDFNAKTMASEGYGPDSPYWSVISSRYERLASTIWKNGGEDAAAVAEAIFDAATNGGTPLFVPVGHDTILGARLRGRNELATYRQRLEQALDELA